jgi:hypothetical protein
MNEKKLTVKGHEHLTLHPVTWGMFEIYCKVYENGKRAKHKDGYFLKQTLKVKQ